MASCRALAVLLVSAFAAAGCRTPDYRYARQTRGERPYLGGAADVPDRKPDTRRDPDRKTSLAWGLTFLAGLAAAVGHGGWSTGSGLSEPSLPPDPLRR